MKHSLILTAGVVGGFAVMQVQAVQAQGCPPNSAPVSEQNNVVHCRCVSGFENRGGVCVPATVPAKPANTGGMSAPTKQPEPQMTESAAELVEIFNRAASELNLPKGPATDRDLVRLKCQAYFRAVGNLVARAGRQSWDSDFPGLNAGGIAKKIAYESQHGGNWQAVDISSAQGMANRGAIVVGASPEDASGHAHLGFVMPLPTGLDESRFSGTGPFVRDGNEHEPKQDPKFYPSSWGAVKASKAFSLPRTKWYVFVPSKP